MSDIHQKHVWNESLSEAKYLKDRLRPETSNLDYLVLKDLRDFVISLKSKVTGKVFDYGCGGAPYRALFTDCESYIGADIVPGPRVDILLAPDGLTKEPSESYDVVFSSQVLEHVQDLEQYLREVNRILKPGGTVIVTTHGMFQEHGCPNDFYRWTPHGLSRLLTNFSFEVKETFKITCGIRAAFYLIHVSIENSRVPERPFFNVLFALLRRIYRHIAQPTLNWFVNKISRTPFRPGTAPDPLFIGIAAIANKP